MVNQEEKPAAVKVWSWRQAIQEVDLPSTTKLVLFNLSVYMNERGQGCYPSTKQQAIDCNLSERAVCTHLDLAEKAGLIAKKAHGFAGQKWKSNEYFALMPTVSPSVKGTEPRSVAFYEGTEPDDIKALNDVQCNTSKEHSKKKIIKEKSVKLDLATWENKNAVLSISDFDDWMKELNLDQAKVEKELSIFRDKCLQQGYVYADFKAAFRNWIRNAQYGRGLQYYQFPAGGVRPPALTPKNFNFASVPASGNNL